MNAKTCLILGFFNAIMTAIPGNFSLFANMTQAAIGFGLTLLGGFMLGSKSD